MIKSNKINTIFVFALLLLLLINLKFQLLDSEWTLLLYVIPMFLFYFLRIDSRFFIIFAIIFLIYSAITLAFFDNEEYANLIAINAYYGLVAGVILQLVEHLKNRENLFYAKEIGQVIFNLEMPKTSLSLSKTPAFKASPNKPVDISGFLTRNTKPILAMTLVFAIFEVITGYLYLTHQNTYTNYDTLFFLASILFFPFVFISLICIILKRKN